MTQLRSRARRGGLLLFVASLFAVAMFSATAHAQTTACPAGGRGGAGGDGGRSTGANGGLSFTVPGLGTVTGGSADASGGDGGTARGGAGGRGGSGTLPICNQNTNGAAPAVAAAPAYGGGGGGGAAPARVGGYGGGLARTGARTYTEVGIAGLVFMVGGVLLFLGQPLRRARRQ